MAKKYYLETGGGDLIISEAEDGSIRWIDDELLEAIDNELPEWFDLFEMNRMKRADVVFRFLRNGGDDDRWNDTDSTLSELMGDCILIKTDIVDEL